MLRYLICFLFLFGVKNIWAQVPKCGFGHIVSKMSQKGYPLYKDTEYNYAQKNTQTDYGTIPVVFHVVLSQSQLNQLGGEAGLKLYIDRQLEVLNKDFNAENEDSIDIPAAFKPLYGNTGLRFALARTSPDGSFTEGIEYNIISKTGVELDGFHGSMVGFSDAKYAASGGLDSWDPATYLNIWIINPLELGSPTNILGLTISHSFAAYYDIPENEVGIILHYKTWNSLINFRGRTLTHEMGHFLGLRHTWGDDEGKCAFNGGEDDGVDDTPQQAYPTYRCPPFPKTDNCAPDSPGIMFMNFMDYTDDDCQLMFTHGQVARMKTTFAIYGDAYSLTQHPEVLEYPATSDRNGYVLYPNPSNGKINLRFNRTPQGLEYIHVINMFGQSVLKVDVIEQRGLYLLDLSAAGSGMYFIQLKLADKTEVEKVVITRN